MGRSIACIGGAHIDRHGVLAGPLVLGTSNPGRVSSDFGGVARNVAENLARLGVPTSILSRVGDDESGRGVLAHLGQLGIDTSQVTISAASPTASYTAVLQSDGELVLGLADMQIYDEITPALIEPVLPRLRAYDFWFADANLPGEMTVTVTMRPVLCGTELTIVQEGVPEVIPVEMCYLGWQDSLRNLAKLVEPEINQ